MANPVRNVVKRIMRIVSDEAIECGNPDKMRLAIRLPDSQG